MILALPSHIIWVENLIFAPDLKPNIQRNKSVLYKSVRDLNGDFLQRSKVCY